MKRTLMVLAAACALLLTLGAGPAFADGLLPSLPSNTGQTVSNGTDQSNEAVAVNVPIASGNNVALINGGDQSASAGTSQSQENENATGQGVSQSGGCGCSGDESVSNRTDQSNEALAVNVPIASGNNLALVNTGDQTASAGTTQTQENENATSQHVRQSSGRHSGSDQQVRNRTRQENEAYTANVPILSGNDGALVNCGHQDASAGTVQSQENENATWQHVEQRGSSGTCCRPRPCEPTPPCKEVVW